LVVQRSISSFENSLIDQDFFDGGCRSVSRIEGRLQKHRSRSDSRILARDPRIMVANLFLGEGSTVVPTFLRQQNSDDANICSSRVGCC
jgi:hypothetical protein